MLRQAIFNICNFLQRLISYVKPRKITYFLPGEIGFFIQHDQNVNVGVPEGIDNLVNLIAGSGVLDKLDKHVADEIRSSLITRASNPEKKDKNEGELEYLPPKEEFKPVQRSFPRAVTIGMPYGGTNDELPSTGQSTTTLYVKTNLNDSDLFHAVDSMNTAAKPVSDPKESVPAPRGISIGQGSRLMGATFNWLASSAQGGGGTVGGPGAIPVPISQATAQAELQSEVNRILANQIKIVWAEPEQGPKVQVAQALTAAKERISKQDVDSNRRIEIAILDTLPALPLLAAQFHQFVGSRIGNGENPTLRAMLGSNFNLSMAHNISSEYLTFTPPWNDDDQIQFKFSYNLMRHHDERVLMDFLADEDEGIGLYDYHHKMADHGLFVAGTISDYVTRIAPQAKVRIHLIQVLSDYGVGTLGSLQHGLNFVLNNSGRDISMPLVINCSLMMTAPRYQHIFKFFRLDNHARELVKRLTTPPSPPDKKLPPEEQLRNSQSDWIVDMFQPIEDIINSFPTSTDGGKVPIDIIAAAGNEHFPSIHEKPKARYPAAFRRVIGVGAARADGSDTNYTNERDAPPSQGVNIIGGEATWDLRLKAYVADQGVPGVYISAFPRLPRVGGGYERAVNQSGWARWAGTSFAAPRATAIQAVFRYFNR